MYYELHLQLQGDVLHHCDEDESRQQVNVSCVRALMCAESTGFVVTMSVMNDSACVYAESPLGSKQCKSICLRLKCRAKMHASGLSSSLSFMPVRGWTLLTSPVRTAPARTSCATTPLVAPQHHFNFNCYRIFYSVARQS